MKAASWAKDKKVDVAVLFLDKVIKIAFTMEKGTSPINWKVSDW